MKNFSLLFAVLVVSVTSQSQTNVDRLARDLDALSRGSFDSWKVSQDLRRGAVIQGDPTASDFDDSKWETLKLGESVYPDSCWIRKMIVLPNRILGEEVRGTVRLFVSVDDYGYMWINGQPRGHFPWNGEFELTRDARGGQRFLIAIKAVNTGGPLRLIRAELAPESLKPLRQFVDDLSLSFRVGQKLLSFDTYQTNARVKVDRGTDRSRMDRSEKTRLYDVLQKLAAEVDVDALAAGSLEKFRSSVERVRARLQPIAAYAKRFTLFFDSNAHIDAAWLWREKETVEVCKNTFASVLNMMNARSDFTYTQSSAVYYDWMERLYPEIFEEILAKVKTGRWEVVGGMWVEPDCNLPGGESWVRHLLYSKRYFQKKLGVNVRIGWNPDSFGYNWNMPQFYRNAGIDAFITQKIGWNETNVFPHRVFWWEGPDGTRILTYFPFDYVNTVEDAYQLTDWLRQFEANTGFTRMMMLFGVGDHGGGPSLEMLARIDRLQSLDVYPSIEHGTATQYLDWLRSRDLSAVPVWKDELYLEYHQGTFTTQAKMKEYNRRSEVLLTNAEKFSAIASLDGGTYPGLELEKAWQSVLFNQFHDILPGSGIRENYLDATEKYEAVRKTGEFVTNRALEGIARGINTSGVGKGRAVVVFNPLAWERTDIAVVHLGEGDENAYAIFDGRGRELPSQEVRKSRYEREILFLAENLPPTGYRVYGLQKKKPAAHPSPLDVSLARIENDRFRVVVDPYTGWVKSMFDKRHGREILGGDGNELQILEDRPSQWDAWNIGLTGARYPSKLRSVEIIETGPVRAVLRLTRDYLKPGVKKDFPTEDFPSSFFVQEIILYHGIDRIDFKTDIDWWEDKTMLKVSFPLSVTDTAALYEIPYGTIQRSTLIRDSWEKSKVEVPTQRWADLSGKDYGVSLLNRGKYGYDIKGSTMRLSLLRSPRWPDPTADRGKHSIEYAIYPHKGRWRDGMTTRRGYEYNNPPIVLFTGSHAGRMPDAHSFVRLEPSTLVLTTMKRAEDGDSWIVQWYDAAGEATTAALTLPKPPKKVSISNFLEEDLSPLEPRGNTVRIPTGKNRVVTIKLDF